MDIFEENFDAALKIHAICFDEDLSDEEARILTYIHAKTNKSDKGLNYFDDYNYFDEQALEILLGNQVAAKEVTKDASELEVEAAKFLLETNRYLKVLDAAVEKKFGLERRFQNELSHRLRLYKDPVYRKKMIDLYTSKIVPKILKYTKNDINRSFLNYRIKAAKENRVD